MSTMIEDVILDPYNSDDVQIAIRAAIKMTELFREDFCILTDLRVVRMSENDEPPLEIIRYNRADDWRYQ